MEYNFREIEKKWHDYWIAEKVYKVEKDTNKPKYYVLDMFLILPVRDCTLATRSVI